MRYQRLVKALAFILALSMLFSVIPFSLVQAAIFLIGSEFVYDDVYVFAPLSLFDERVGIGVEQNGKKGILDRNLNQLIPMKYDDIYVNGQLVFVSQNDKWGIIDLDGNEIVAIQYEDMNRWNITDNLVPVKKNSKWGVIDLQGNEIVPAQYDDVYIDKENGVIRVEKDDKRGAFDLAGNKIASAVYDDTGEYVDGLISVCNEWKWGVVDTKGNQIVPIEYDLVNLTAEAIQVIKDGNYGVFDRQGKEVVPVEDRGYYCHDFVADFLVIHKGDKYGVVDAKGNKTIWREYDWVHYWGAENGLIPVEKNWKCGVINISGEEIVPFEYDSIYVYDKIIEVQKDGKYGALDYEGNNIVPTEYDWIYSYDNVIKVWKDDKYGAFDYEGNNIVPVEYDNIYSYDNVMEVWKDGYCGAFDYEGNNIVPVEYDNIYYYDNVMEVWKDGYCGAFDYEGNNIVPVEYDWIYSYDNVMEVWKDGYRGAFDYEGNNIVPAEYDDIEITENAIWVIKDGNYGIFDGQGNVIVPVIDRGYFCYSLMDGFVIIYTDGGYGVVDAKGNKTIWREYDWVYYWGAENGLIPVEKDRKYGVINVSGEEIIPFEYDSIYIYDKIIEVQKDGKYGALDYEGNNIVPTEYDWIYSYDNVIKVWKDDKYGAFDYEGNNIVPVEYDNIYSYDNVMEVWKDGYCGAFDYEGNNIVPVEYDNIYSYDNVMEVWKDGYCGAFDYEGNNIVPVEYDNIYSYDNVMEVWKDDKYGAFDYEGNNIVPVEYDDIEITENAIWVIKDGNYGIFDGQGNVIVPVIDRGYFCYSLMDGFVIIHAESDKYGIIDEHGREVIPLEYDYIISWNIVNDLVPVEKDGKYGVMNLKGQEIVPLEYDYIYLNGLDNVINTWINDKCGLLDFEGKVLIEPKYDYVDNSYIENGLVIVLNEGKWGVVTLNGRDIVPANYDDVYINLQNNVISVCKNDKWGLFDLDGNVLLEPQYDDVDGWNINDGLVSVELNEKWGILSLDGRHEIVPIKYDDILLLPNRFFIAKENEKYNLYNIGQEEAVLRDIDRYEYAEGDILALRKGQKWAVIKLTATGDIPVRVTGVSLNEAAKTVKVGDSFTLIATVTPDNATNKEVTWSSSDESVAVVDEEGKVTAVGVGTAIIKVTTVDGGYEATCEVIVEAETVRVTGVSLNETAKTIKIGDSFTLVATVTPENATNKEVTWSSSDTQVAVVDKTGKVTAVGAGTAVITVTTVDGGFTASCQVTVELDNEPINENTVEISSDVFTGEEDDVISVKEVSGQDDLPVDVKLQIKAWLEAIKEKLGEEEFQEIKVIIKEYHKPVEEIEDEETKYRPVSVVYEFTLMVDGVVIDEFKDKIEMVFEYDPDEISDPEKLSVFWYDAANDRWVKIESRLGEGNTIIGITDHWSKFAVFEEVEEQTVVNVTGVSLNETAKTVKVGDSFTLVATVTPDNATNKEVTWSSSNTEVAVVDENGNVVAVGAGKATITVTTVDGGYTASCEVTVELEQSELDIRRITGSTRLVTAVNISKEGWPSGARYAVLTSGWEFADALAGSTFAYLKDAPILLTRPSSLSAEVKDELKRLKVEKVYILGGNAAVSDDVANELVWLGYTVERIYGSQRFETAVKIGDEIRKEKAFDTVILATSHNFPDALAIGPVAAREGMPILFTRPGSLHETTKEAIRKWGIRKVIIVGGNAAVSKEIEEELKGMGLSVDRVSGSDRYWTSVEIARRFDKGDYNGVMMATGLNFADALTGSVLAAKKGMPIILSRQTVLVPSVEEYLKETDYGKSRIVVLGGTAAIAEEVIDRIRLMWAAGM